jgi:hypothetical protein
MENAFIFQSGAIKWRVKPRKDAVPEDHPSMVMEYAAGLSPSVVANLEWPRAAGRSFFPISCVAAFFTRIPVRATVSAEQSSTVGATLLTKRLKPRPSTREKGRMSPRQSSAKSVESSPSSASGRLSDFGKNCRCGG